MNSETKQRFDALEALREAAFRSFDTRRNHEWKVSLTIWTTLAALSGVILTGRLTVQGQGPAVVTGLLAVFLIILHSGFQRGVARAQGNDRKIEYFFRTEMMALAGTDFSDQLKLELGIASNTTGTLRNWSHFFQVGVTILLAIVVVASVTLAARDARPAEEKPASTDSSR